eukprot:UN09619
MQWNDYQNEPDLSSGDPCDAIACRRDLEPKRKSYFGGIDGKVSAASKVTTNGGISVEARVGPTHDDVDYR